MAAKDEWKIVIEPDRARRPAGESARAKASELFRAQPVRSTLGRLLRASTDEHAWRKGGKGERSVGKILDKLPKDSFYVSHDLEIGSRQANVDHLVIGRAGVFSINTKNLKGRVRVTARSVSVNGHKRSEYLPKAVHEARRVSRCLSAATDRIVTVTPMLVFICDELVVKAKPPDIVVLGRGELLNWLLARPRVLTLEEASQISKAAGRVETWRAG